MGINLDGCVALYPRSISISITNFISLSILISNFHQLSLGSNLQSTTDDRWPTPTALQKRVWFSNQKKLGTRLACLLLPQHAAHVGYVLCSYVLSGSAICPNLFFGLCNSWFYETFCPNNALSFLDKMSHKTTNYKFQKKGQIQILLLYYMYVCVWLPYF